MKLNNKIIEALSEAKNDLESEFVKLVELGKKYNWTEYDYSSAGTEKVIHSISLNVNDIYWIKIENFHNRKIQFCIYDTNSDAQGENIIVHFRSSDRLDSEVFDKLSNVIKGNVVIPELKKMAQFVEKIRKFTF